MAPPVEKVGAGLSNLQKRTLSAVVLVPVVVAAIVLGYPYFEVLVVIFTIAMAWEWTRIITHHRVGTEISPVPVPGALPSPVFGLAVAAAVSLLVVRFAFFAPGNLWIGVVAVAAAVGLASLLMARRQTHWFVAGVAYVAVPAVALILIRSDPTYGLATMIWIVALVIAADTGGYIVGRSVGGPKLAPRISPNKTWSGLGGAVLGAALTGLCTAFILNHTNVLVLTLVSAILGLLEQGGDLVESALKRHFGVKDTSQIIPGHGGVLDRVDGLLAVAVAVLVLNMWAGGSVLAW
jgi:phosphatidate cytidylyltransferase